MVEQEPARSRSGSPETRRALADAAMVSHCPWGTERRVQAVMERLVDWVEPLASITPTTLGTALQNGLTHAPGAGSAPQIEARTGGCVS